MATAFPYTSVDASPQSSIPPAPLIKMAIATPGKQPKRTIECLGFLDTGADCTLVPFDILTVVQATVAGSRERITGTEKGSMMVIPYFVGVRLAQYSYPVVRVRGCPSQALGGMVLVGRDLLNRVCVEFNGPVLTFAIS